MVFQERKVKQQIFNRLASKTNLPDIRKNFCSDIVENPMKIFRPSLPKVSIQSTEPKSAFQEIKIVNNRVDQNCQESVDNNFDGIYISKEILLPL